MEWYALFVKTVKQEETWQLENIKSNVPLLINF